MPKITILLFSLLMTLVVTLGTGITNLFLLLFVFVVFFGGTDSVMNKK